MQTFDNNRPNALKPTAEAMVQGRANHVADAIHDAEVVVERVYPTIRVLNPEIEPPMASPVAVFEPTAYEPLASEPVETAVPVQPMNDLDLEAIRAQVRAA
jgi:hypothetical protein